MFNCYLEFQNYGRFKYLPYGELPILYSIAYHTNSFLIPSYDTVRVLYFTYITRLLHSAGFAQCAWQIADVLPNLFGQRSDVTGIFAT